MKMKKKMQKVVVYLIPVILVTGSALGAVVWLMDAEVPIDYDDPYTVSMSQNETSDNYEWQELEFRETTTTKTAYFNETGSGIFYHQYVKIENPTDGVNVNVEADIKEPTGFNDQMGFTIMSGIVHPGEAEQVEVQRWGNISTGDTAVAAGETVEFTVIYTLSNDVPASDSYDVTWNFYEGESVTVNDGESIQNAIDSVSGTVIFVEDGTYEENITVNKGVTLFGMNKPTIDGRVTVTANGAAFEGFDVSPPVANKNLEAEAIRVSNGADNVIVKNNVVRDFEKGQVEDDQWWGIDGINVFGGENDPIEDVTIINNEVKRLQNDVEAGVAGISIQGNVVGATVEQNQVTEVGMKNTPWAFGIVVRGTGNHDKVPTDVEVHDNVVDIILSDPGTKWAGVGLGLESGDAKDVDFEGNDVNTTEFLLEDKTATINLRKFADANNLDRGALLEGADFSGTDYPTRNVIFNSIQAAINASADGDTIYLDSGTYTGTVNISNMNNIEIIGTQKGEVILEPESTLDWDVGGYGSDRQVAIRMVNSTDVLLQRVTLDLNEVKGDMVYGILLWNVEGTIDKNIVKNNQIDDSESVHEKGAYVRAVDYTHSDRAEVTVSNNEFRDVGRIGLNVHDYVDIMISENEFYKTENDFGYGIELGSESIGEITNNTLYGFDTEYEGWASAGIYIENCFTYDVSDGFTKPVLVEDNEVYDSQHGIHIGNEFDGYAGPVEIDVTLRSNYIHDNLEEGIIIADEDAEDGSSVTVTSQNNVIENNGEAGYFIYTNGDGDITIELSNDAIKNNDYGVTLNDTAIDSTSVYDISVNNSTIDENSIYGINNTIESETIDATYNWWGTTTESEIQDNLYGDVEYEPWLDGSDGDPVYSS